MPPEKPLRVLIAHLWKLKYTETFIRSHISELPADVVPLDIEDLAQNWSPLLPLSNSPLFVRKMLCPVFNQSSNFRNQALEFLLKHNKIDVVLAEYGPTAVCMQVACKRASVPLIPVFLGYDAYRKDEVEPLMSSYKYLFQDAYRVVAMSQHMRCRLVELGAPPDKVCVIPCGAKTNEIMSSPADSPPSFLFVGRFVDKKAPQLVLLAFARSLATTPGSTLKMVGDGPLLEVCKSLVKALNLGNQVTFEGALKHDEIAQLFRNCRAVINHSVTPTCGDSEGMPVSILEAGMAGLPVIATRHAGIHECIVDGETGFLVEEHDVNTMARRIEQLARDPQLAARMGNHARRRMQNKHSLERTISDLYCVIRQASEANRKHPAPGHGLNTLGKPVQRLSRLFQSIAQKSQ